MANTYDVAVVGLGAMGSATAYQLSRTPGLRVLGLDRHRPPHVHGSTHGDTRATRCAPFEGDELVAMVRRSTEIYADELGPEAGRTLFERSGGLIVGRPGAPGYHHVDDPFRRTVEAAEAHGVPHELLTPGEVAARFPHVSLADDERAYYEPGGGFLYAEECVRAHLDGAAARGADLHYFETVLGYETRGDSVRVTTDRGTYDVGTLVVAAGPWAGQLLGDLPPIFELQRVVTFWFELADDAWHEAHASGPRVGWAFGAGGYAFPALDGPAGGVKVATEEHSVVATPDLVERRVTAAEAQHVFDTVVRDRLLGVGPGVVRSATCLYTMTPDARFVIDRHPGHPNVIVASPCSGHGFKHSAAVGETVAELVTTGTTTLDIEPFRLDRLLAVAR